MRTHLVQAVPAVTRLVYVPRIAGPVPKGLRDAVQRRYLVPVAGMAPRIFEILCGACSR